MPPPLSTPSASLASGGDAAAAAALPVPPEPSFLASQLSRSLEALDSGFDLDVVERALAAEDKAAKAAEAAALAAVASLGA